MIHVKLFQAQLFSDARHSLCAWRSHHVGGIASSLPDCETQLLKAHDEPAAERQRSILACHDGHGEIRSGCRAGASCPSSWLILKAFDACAEASSSFSVESSDEGPKVKAPQMLLNLIVGGRPLCHGYSSLTVEVLALACSASHGRWLALPS